jgi:hypothetical protein
MLMSCAALKTVTRSFFLYHIGNCGFLFLKMVFLPLSPVKFLYDELRHQQNKKLLPGFKTAGLQQTAGVSG